MTRIADKYSHISCSFTLQNDGNEEQKLVSFIYTFRQRLLQQVSSRSNREADGDIDGDRILSAYSKYCREEMASGRAAYNKLLATKNIVERDQV